MIVCESGGHANGLTYFIFRFLRRPHFRGYGFIATNGFGTKCSEYTDAACGAKARQLANSPHRLLNYFQMLVQGLSMPLS